MREERSSALLPVPEQPFPCFFFLREILGAQDASELFSCNQHRRTGLSFLERIGVYSF